MVWEVGEYFRKPGHRREMLIGALDLLGRCGFRTMLPAPGADATFVPYDLDMPHTGNVFAISPTLE